MAVSEPPPSGRPADRWPNESLALLGMTRQAGDQGGIAVIVQVEACRDRYPRRAGIPTKRPLF